METLGAFSKRYRRLFDLQSVLARSTDRVAKMISNEAERRGIAKILGYLNQNDQSDLVLTVTNRMIQNFEAKGESKCLARSCGFW